MEAIIDEGSHGLEKGLTETIKKIYSYFERTWKFYKSNNFLINFIGLVTIQNKKISDLFIKMKKGNY